MPLITRVLLKTGILFFVASILTGIALQIDALALPPVMPLFWHMLMLGWITQIIMGVSFWMFPGRMREESFRNQFWGWLAYFGLNAGLLLRIIGEPAVLYSPAAVWKVVLFISAVLQFSAGAAYAIEIWPRIKGKKKRPKRTHPKTAGR